MLTDVSVKPGVRGNRFPRNVGNHEALTGVINRKNLSCLPETLPCPPELAFGPHPEPVQSTQYSSLHIYLGSAVVMTSAVSLCLQSGLFLPRLRGDIHHLSSRMYYIGHWAHPLCYNNNMFSFLLRNLPILLILLLP